MTIDPVTHEKLLGLVYEYFFTGGMPEAINIYLENRSDSVINAAINTPVQNVLDFHLSPYKGYLAENFCAQTLHAKGHNPLYSFRESNGKNSAEIEFLFHNEVNGLIPIEVKSSKKSLNAKSLLAFVNKFDVAYGYKISPLPNIEKKNKIISLPIYLTEKI